ncbi:MAG: hypothetical protein J5786_01585 [Clostridiales bacterium]|nr:hypothetical protein [Clostridiales bacterium]
MKLFQKIMTVAMASAIIFGCGSSLNAATTTYNINKTFPDAALRKYVSQYDLNKDGNLNSNEISKAGESYGDTRSLTLMDSNISNLEGLQIFTSCKVLLINGCGVKKLDMTKMPFEQVYLGNFSEMTTFVCGKKQKEVTLQFCDKLKDANFDSATNLTGLYLQECRSIDELLFLDNCDKFSYFYAIESKIEEVYFSPKARLDTIGISSCPISGIDMPGTGLATLKTFDVTTTARYIPNITCKPDLGRILWNNRVANNKGYQYKSNGVTINIKFA